jgi:protein-S-isoprenylcysteine O-methyltransferase Ste14
VDDFIATTVNHRHDDRKNGRHHKPSSLARFTFIALGLLPLIGATYLFLKANTTVNPTKPENSSQLVTHGIFKYTRNPMYLGFLLCLIGWSLWLGNIFTISGAMIFYWYINEHQIPFEEEALAEKFSEQYHSYCKMVRR